MSLKQRIRDDETGFAIVLAVALIAVLSIFAATLPLLVQNEDSKSRRDQSQDGAFQAAEAGTNAVLSDLTQSTAFFKKYMAKGEATRTFGGINYANDCVTGSTSHDAVDLLRQGRVGGSPGRVRGGPTRRPRRRGRPTWAGTASATGTST